MSDHRDLRTAEADPPTRMLPLAQPTGSRHRAPDDGRRLMWATVAGAAVVVVIAALVLAFAGDDDPVPTAAPTVVASELAAGPEASEEPVLPEASPTPTPSPSPTSRRTASPAELLAGLRSTLDGLVQQRQLRPNAGKELRKQLREVGGKIADGDLGEARDKLREFARQVADLRREGRLSASGYDALMGGATQLVQALSTR